MGTNYYLQHEVNDAGRVQDMHICKTSAGWTPSLRGYDKTKYPWHEYDITSWFAWKLFIKERVMNNSGKIFNEYDEFVEFKEFIERIEEWQSDTNIDGRAKKNHAAEAMKGEFGRDATGGMDSHAQACWIDPEGYSFHDGEFS